MDDKHYSIALAYEHCVVQVSIFDVPADIDEDELEEIAIDAIESDFGPIPRHYHDVMIEELEL
jgi:hypothetical protein